MTSTPSVVDPAAQTFADVPCTVCGCVCDDLQVSVSEGRITPISGACKLAEPWFEALSEAQQNPPPVARVEGRVVSLDQAIERAAEILRNARAPLVWGLSRSSTAGQRAAVALAEQLGATIDTTASVCHGPSIMAIQQVGESTCSLGEVRNRADLIVFWGANPVDSHPRHFERYSVDAAGMLVPRGRADRTVIVIDKKPTATSAVADNFIQVPPDRDFEVIWALRQLLKGMELPTTFDVGVPHEVLRSLAQQLKSCRYGAVFFGLGLAQRGIGHMNVEALLQLVADLNDHTRFTARRLRIPGDVTGADSVLCWQTGFPFAVNLARGFPRYNPGEYSANELLARGEVDACLFVGSEGIAELSAQSRSMAAKLPMIAIDYPHVKPMIEATLQITTAVYGIHAPGTVYRMDEIPIALRQLARCDYPTDDEVLQLVQRRL